MRILNKLIALIIAGGIGWCVSMGAAYIMKYVLLVDVGDLFITIAVLLGLMAFVISYKHFKDSNFLNEYDIDPEWYGVAEEVS